MSDFKIYQGLVIVHDEYRIELSEGWDGHRIEISSAHGDVKIGVRHKEKQNTHRFLDLFIQEESNND